MSNRTNPIFTAVLGLILLPAMSFAAMTEEAAECSGRKADATARAFACLAKKSVAAIKGGSAVDPEKCFAPMAKKFAKAEEPGECVATSDTSDAADAASDAVAGTLEALLVSDGAYPHDIRCLKGELKVLSAYARCMAKAWTATLNGAEAPRSTGECHVEMAADYSAVEQKYMCPDLAEYHIAPMVGPAAAYFPKVDLSGRDLSLAYMGGARLADADFTGSDLTDAVLSGAELPRAVMTNAGLSRLWTTALSDFTGVTWSNTTCADDTISDANGGTCCGHFFGSTICAP